MKHALLNSIEHALMLGCDIRFTKTIPGHFNIEVSNQSIQHVTLPMQDHLNEDKCAKYVTMLTNEATKSNQLVADNNG